MDMIRIGKWRIIDVKRGKRMIKILMIDEDIDIKKKIEFFEMIVIGKVEFGYIEWKMRDNKSKMKEKIGIVGSLENVFERRKMKRKKDDEKKKKENKDWKEKEDIFIG